MKRTLLTALIVVLITFSCSDHDDVKKTSRQPYEIATSWADMTLKIVKSTPPNSPTFCSRNLGYIGLTMYECVVHGNGSYKSLTGQLSELNSLPLPESGEDYSWEIVLNAGQARILKNLYDHTSELNLADIDSLENTIHSEFKGSVSNEVSTRSISYGQEIANAIYEWSKTDGGHESYLHNFDPEYAFPSGASYWTPPVGGQSPSKYPLHPYWGSNRTFVIANASLAVPEILPYSTDPSSDYYKQFQAVHDKSKTLTTEEKEISAWWADDPSQTASPPGHSYNLCTIAVKTSKPDIYKAAEAYAKVGMAVADAFINCWKCKYTYHAERPYPYIKAYIDEAYTPFWPEPPFPAFSSGHATQSAAAAIVLASVFGEDFSLIDNTYEGRQPSFQNIQYKPRQYDSFWATAEECAYSRFLGGIHTSQDNEKGNAQGVQVGENVNALSWKN